MSAQLYRTNQRWQIWAAFLAAILIHLSAVALAALRSDDLGTGDIASPPFVDVTAEFPELTPPDPIDELPPPPAPPTSEDIFTTEETPSPPVVDRPPRAVVRRMTSNVPRSINSQAAKVLALSAPRPEYPYEARRQRLTGSGEAVLTVDSASGAVIRVAMSRSTGSSTLDDAAIRGLSRWRFRPGTVSRVITPITFTLTGAVY